jgi:putative ATPase
MEDLGYGAEYKYSHEYEKNFVEQQYLPDRLKDNVYYHPTNNGAEQNIRARLTAWWKSKKR